MCACEPGFVCSRCADTPDDPRRRAFLAALTDAECAYMIERGGETYPKRAYGIEYRR